MDDKLLLAVIENRARISTTDLAVALDEAEDDVIERMNELERQKVICGYHTVINWDKTHTDIVTALIELKATPEKRYGYDRIAKKILRYQEIETMYLLSGAYDFLCIVKGRTMQEVAHFVASNLASIDGVTGTSTTFVLKCYKNSGIVMDDDTMDGRRRLVVT